MSRKKIPNGITALNTRGKNVCPWVHGGDGRRGFESASDGVTIEDPQHR